MDKELETGVRRVCKYFSLLAFDFERSTIAMHRIKNLTEIHQDVGEQGTKNEVDLVGTFNLSRIFAEYLLDYNFVLVNYD